jgi:hypothetical protein
MTQDEIYEMAYQAEVKNEFNYDFRLSIETFAKLVSAKEQDRCCAIVFAQCESDNVAQRTVDAIRGKA